jgi:hypothetical protein
MQLTTTRTVHSHGANNMSVLGSQLNGFTPTLEDFYSMSLGLVEKDKSYKVVKLVGAYRLVCQHVFHRRDDNYLYLLVGDDPFSTLLQIGRRANYTNEPLTSSLIPTHEGYYAFSLSALPSIVEDVEKQGYAFTPIMTACEEDDVHL